jgi:hypothetical protein
MIDDKEIDDAKEEIYKDKFLGCGEMVEAFANEDEKEMFDKEDIKEAIGLGAKWAINEFIKYLWHPNTEEPDKSKSDIITLGFENDAYLQFKESILWNEESWRHSISRCQIIKWAYLSDILPKEGSKQ